MFCDLCLKPKTHCIACLLLLIDLAQVIMEARTPEAMIEELDTLTQAITGLSSTLRSRIKSESERAQLASPRVSPLSKSNGYRRLTPGEIQLEETKSEQRKLQEERVASRVAELSISAEKAKARRKSMSSANVAEGKEGNSSTPIREVQVSNQ